MIQYESILQNEDFYIYKCLLIFKVTSWRRQCTPLQHSCLENHMDGGAW